MSFVFYMGFCGCCSVWWVMSGNVITWLEIREFIILLFVAVLFSYILSVTVTFLICATDVILALPWYFTLSQRVH